ncbi:hypothetical protein AVEN_93327-1 [Araneus ventricosus]|uniref:Uncharacterized protein n=1 Tax=Araneus ventricosus TaxID=182803 RepID=A0A4Y2SCL7_ARAVE|nr:hypothetical protein AVEN_93327-1 [Araneus ventricosus]
MNIIEPIWVALQCAVQKRSPPPGTPMNLWIALQDSWCEKPPGYLQTLVDIMPRRIASLLCARVRQVYVLYVNCKEREAKVAATLLGVVWKFGVRHAR